MPSTGPGPTQPSAAPTASLVPRHMQHPPHRHAAPSAPWPWIDSDDAARANDDWPEAENVYPQSHFGNWTHSQVRKCGIKAAIDKVCECDVYTVDVLSSGNFKDPERRVVTEEAQSKQAFKNYLGTPREQDNRVRTLCVENMSGPVLQMLGAVYNIEPFFFSSSLNWIPSRYQEDLQPGKGDHITITLTFLRKMDNPGTYPPDRAATTKGTRGINTQDGLYLNTDDGNVSALCRDLLAVHMIRSVNGSTIISYHDSPTLGGTSAKHLYSRVHLAGQSVYWTKLFNISRDPTFVLLTILWHALYAWDEALTCLYEHISDQESAFVNTRDKRLTQRTQELHRIRAHLLYYASLLDDFKKSVKFVLDTPNPAMDAPENGTERMLTKEDSAERLKTECKNLLSEIDRLEMSRSNQSKRLKNIMNLAFATVNIDDSKTMQMLTKAAAQDSSAMKQIAYLTMVFLPSSFIAAIFGMNINIINPDSVGTLPHYFAVAVPMTLVTIWAVVAFNPKKDYAEGQREASYSTRLAWPVRAWKSVFLRRTQSDLEAQDDPPAYSHSDR